MTNRMWSEKGQLFLRLENQTSVIQFQGWYFQTTAITKDWTEICVKGRMP